MAPNSTSDKFGFGWNTGGKLAKSLGGHSYGVMGQSPSMPGTTTTDSEAAAHDQYRTTPGKRILIVTIAPDSSTTDPTGSMELIFGAYPWKDYHWEMPGSVNPVGGVDYVAK